MGEHRTFTRTSTVNVSTTPVMIAEHHPKRRALAIINHGSSDVLVAPHESPGTGSAIVVAAGGGMLTLTQIEDFETTTLPFFARSTTGTNSVFVVETIEE